MNIVFLTHYFHPEGNAPATRVYEMARRWVSAGHKVTVITGVPNVPNGVPYPGYANQRLQRETIAGINVLRVWTYLAPNKGTMRRTLNYLSFMVTAARAGRTQPLGFAGSVATAAGDRPDVVIATSPQFFCGWAGALVARALRVPFILEIRDIWPESIRTVGAVKASLVIRFLENLERRLYRRADHIVTVGDGYLAQLIQRGVSSERISVIPNGVDRQAFSPRDADGGIRRRYRMEDAFVCAYVGTIGMAAGLDAVLGAAVQLKMMGRDDIRFLLAGDGAEREQLQKEAFREGLSNVVFTGRLDKSQVVSALATSDACLVHLRKADLFRFVMPSKLYEASAMAKPIILGVEGHAAALVKEADAGICIEPGNVHQLVAAVLALADDEARRVRLGRNAAERIAPRFDVDNLAIDYLKVIDSVTRQLSYVSRVL